MNKQQTSSKNKSPDKYHAYYLFELEKVIERINSHDTLRLQIAAFFGTINITVLGIAFTTKQSGVVILAAFALLAFLLIEIHERRLVIALFYRAIFILKAISPNYKESFLLSTPGITSRRAQMIANLESHEEQAKYLRRYTIPFGSPYFVAPLLATIAEISLGVVLFLQYQWVLF